MGEQLIPLDQVTQRLRLVSQRYEGVAPIRLGQIVGSVDRSVDFDHLFRPRRRALKAHVEALREAFADRDMPPITVYRVDDLYFVVDGHHRVALARQLKMEFIDAEVTAIELSHHLTPDVDFLQLIHTEQHRTFKERTRLLARNPDAKILFSRPTAYGELLQLVLAHAYELSAEQGALVPMEEATADWYARSYRPALEAIGLVGLSARYEDQTEGDLFMWVNAKLRELQTTNRDASWTDAAEAARRERVSRGQRRETVRQRRSPLPRT